MTRALVGVVLAVAGQALAWPLPFGPVSGNRVAAGAGTFPRWQALGLATDTPIRWLVALPPNRLAAVDRDGTLLVFEIAAGALKVVSRHGGLASADSPPAAVRLDEDQTGVVLVAPDGRLVVWSEEVVRSYDVGGPLSSHTVPVPVAFEGRHGNDLLAVTHDGAVVLISGLAAGNPRAVARVDVQALQDARITVADLDGDGASEAVVLAGPTTRPDVPGDQPAATSVAVVRLRPYGLELRARFSLAPPAVFEDRVPVLARIPGSVRPVVLLARRAPGTGSEPVALRLRDGGLVLLAEGAAGAGRRGTHVVGAADVSGDAVPELIAVAGAQQEGVLTAFRRAGSALAAFASIAGYVAGSGAERLEQAAIADLDGDGRPEVVALRQSREVLVGLDLRGDRFVERWAIDFKSPLTSSLVVADLDGDGLLDLAVGSRRGLHVFQSTH